MHARLLILLLTAAVAVSAQSCPGYTALTAVTGTIAVGQLGQPGHYTDSTSCLWLIDLSNASPPVTSVTITFTRLDTEFYYILSRSLTVTLPVLLLRRFRGSQTLRPQRFHRPETSLVFGSTRMRHSLSQDSHSIMLELNAVRTATALIMAFALEPRVTATMAFLVRCARPKLVDRTATAGALARAPAALALVPITLTAQSAILISAK